MKLKSFGCSFIFGTDLHDDGRDGNWAMPSNYSWPALLSQHLNLQYECYARPGSGNLQIWENIANQISTGEPALFVIGWTWIDRFDYISSDAVWWHRRTKWKTLMPIDQNPTAEIYYKNLHSEHLDKLKSLIYVNSAIDLLRDNDVPFIMTYMDDLMFDSKWNISSGMKPLQQKIQTFLNQFEGKNFLDYSISREHKISHTQHPLESAHRDVADLVINNLQDYIKGEYNAC